MAMKIDVNSCDCVRSELELFDIPPTQTSIEECRYEKRGPTTSLDRGGPLEFKVHVGDEEYLDPGDSFVYIKAKIVDENGDVLVEKDADGKLPDKSIVFPIANVGCSLFSQISVTLNSQSVSSNDGMYAYKAYIENLLSFGSDAKKHQLAAAMFHQDISDMDVHDESVLEKTKNKGAKDRFERTRYSRSFECISFLHSEIFEQPKLILNKVEMNVKLTRNDDDFVLMSKEANRKYRIVIEEGLLYASVKKISSHVRVAHEERLLSSNARYPIRRVKMKFFTKGQNRSDISEPNISNGILPRRIIWGLVATDAFNGSKHKNPFNFYHFGVNHIALRKNGREIPYNGMKLNYIDSTENEYLMAYFTLIHGTNLWRKNISNAIIPTRDYKNGFTLYAANLLPDQSDGSNFSLQEEGSLSLEIRLAKGVDTSITIVCYLEYDSIIEIDKDRQVHYHE